MSYTANRLLVQRQARWCMPSLWIAYWRKERLGISSYIWTIKTIQKLISKHLINSPKSVFNSVLYNLGLKSVISLSQKSVTRLNILGFTEAKKIIPPDILWHVSIPKRSIWNANLGNLLNHIQHNTYNMILQLGLIAQPQPIHPMILLFKKSSIFSAHHYTLVWHFLKIFFGTTYWASRNFLPEKYLSGCWIYKQTHKESSPLNLYQGKWSKEPTKSLLEG